MGSSSFKRADTRNWRTTRKERIKFYIGDIGRSLSGSIVTTFMSMFLMLQGIPLEWVAVALIIVNVVDSVDDVIFGYLIDKIQLKKSKFFRKITGEGKYLPWFRLAAPFFPIFTICFFLMPANISFAGKIVWFVVFDLLYDLFYTIVEVPMNSLVVSITDNMEERNTIIQTKTILSTIVVMFVPMIWLVLVSQKVGLPLVWVASVSAFIFFWFMFPLYKGVKEHNIDLNNVSEDDLGHYSLKDMFKCVIGNKFLLLLLLSSFLTSAFSTSAGSIGIFASFYILGDELILIIPVLISVPLALVFQLLATRIVKRFGKVPTVLVGSVVGIIAFFGIYAFGSFAINSRIAELPQAGDGVNTLINPETGKLEVIHLGLNVGVIIILCIFLVAQAPFGNLANMCRGFMLPDAIEYSRYKQGKDCSGICTSLNSFITKLSTSVASAAGLFILGLGGWKPVEATDFADLAAQAVENPIAVSQPVSSLNTIWIVYALIPTIGQLLAWICMFFYNLKDADIQLMSKCNSGVITRRECEMMMSKSYSKEYKLGTVDGYRLNHLEKKFKKSRNNEFKDEKFSGEKLPVKRANFENIDSYIYRPEDNTGLKPVIIMLHNGNLVNSSALAIDGLCNKLALKSNNIVINLDYASSEEERLAYVIRELTDTIRFIKVHAEEYGIDAKRITVAGLGAGAQILASAALTLKNKGINVQHIILLDPYVDFTKGLPVALESDKNVSVKDKHLLKDMLFGGSKLDLPMISPVYATSSELAGVAKTSIVIYGDDEQSKTNKLYASKLQESGVSCKIEENNETHYLYNSRLNDAEIDAVVDKISLLANETEEAEEIEDLGDTSDISLWTPVILTPEQKKKRKKKRIIMGITIPIGVIVVLLALVVAKMAIDKPVATELALSTTSETIKVGEEFTISLNGSGEYKELKFESEDETIASVVASDDKKSGTVTGVKEGETRIKIEVVGNEAIKDPLYCNVVVDNGAAAKLLTIYGENSNNRTFINFYDDHTYTFFTDYYTPSGAYAALGNLTIWVGDCSIGTEYGRDYDRDTWSIENSTLVLANKASAYMPNFLADGYPNNDKTLEDALWKAELKSTVETVDGKLKISVIVNNGQMDLFPGTFNLTEEETKTILGK